MVLLRWLDELTRRRWFGHALVLAISAVVLVLAATMTPSDAAVTVFGWEVPVVCGFRRLTGHPCPGCGLTRSFTYLAHGHLADAFRINALGPFVFAFVAAQVPLQARRLWLLRRRGG